MPVYADANILSAGAIQLCFPFEFYRSLKVLECAGPVDVLYPEVIDDKCELYSVGHMTEETGDDIVLVSSWI